MGGLGAQESVLVFARFRPQDTKEEHSGGEIKAKFTSNESCSCINDDGNPIGERLNPKPKPYCIHLALAQVAAAALTHLSMRANVRRTHTLSAR
jgi:hypothetical protein